MRRARLDGPLCASRGLPRGLTYLELTICLALMTIILGLFVIVLEGGSDNVMISFTRGELSAGCVNALSTMEEDFRETAASTIDTHTLEEGGFGEPRCAVTLASARDSSGAFQGTSSCRPSWQAVVVYCPYVEANGIRQLRRYVYYDSGYTFPLKFDGTDPITADVVVLRESGPPYRTLTVDRRNGNTAAAPAFTVLCPGLTKLTVETGAPTKLSIAAQSLTRRGVVLEASNVRYVAQRN